MILLGLAARLSSNSSETKYMGVKPLHSPMLKEVHASFLKSICVATYRRKAKKRRLIGLEKKWAVNVVRRRRKRQKGADKQGTRGKERRRRNVFPIDSTFYWQTIFEVILFFFSPRFQCRYNFQLLVFLWQENSFQMANNDSRQNQPTIM